MLDIRRILIIFVVGLLFTIFVFSTINAVYPAPKYTDYCNDFEKPRQLGIAKQKSNCSVNNIFDEELASCSKEGGRPEYKHDAEGCVESWECNFCQKEYNDAREKYNFWSFIVATILGLVGIAISVYLPMKKDTVHEWVGSGFMLGGLLSIFIGTAVYFGDLHRWIRPVVILLELMLVLYLAYTRLAPKNKQ